jgi:NTE family protein
MQKIGLALGGGGAKGLAHIAILEVLDEFGIRPHCIAGTSIGAIIGVLYASGHRGREIHEAVARFSFREEDGWGDLLDRKNDILKWLDIINLNWSGSGLLKADAFLEQLIQHTQGTNFDDLQIPLKVVAADFWKREQVVLDRGELKPAIQASMALPGVFNPVVLGRQVLVDGGAVNPVPFDVIDDCDLVIAVNVMGTRTESADLVPSMTEAVFNTFQIMQASILRHKLRQKAPDIYISPDITDIQMLEFYKADQVFQQSASACEELRQKLRSLGFEPSQPPSQGMSPSSRETASS